MKFYTNLEPVPNKKKRFFMSVLPSFISTSGSSAEGFWVDDGLLESVEIRAKVCSLLSSLELESSLEARRNGRMLLIWLVCWRFPPRKLGCRRRLI